MHDDDHEDDDYRRRYSQLAYRASKLGMRLQSSRQYTPSPDDQALYRLTDKDKTFAILGRHFNATLDDVEWFFGRASGSCGPLRPSNGRLP